MTASRAIGNFSGESIDNFVRHGYSEDSIALAFVERHRCEYVFDAAHAGWLRYDGTRWSRAGDMRPAVRDFCRELVATTIGATDARRLGTEHIVRGVLRLVEMDSRIRADVTVESTDNGRHHTFVVRRGPL